MLYVKGEEVITIHLLNSEVANNFYTLKKEFERIKSLNYIKGVNNNKNASGFTFEEELKSTSGDLCIPDFNNIEIKVLRNYDYASITLFASAPDGNIPLATQWLTENYGVAIPEFDGMNSLICKLSGNKAFALNSYKFLIKIDYEECKVILKIYDAKNNLVNNDIYWDFDTLENKLKSKLSYLAIVNSKKKIINSCNYYAYTDLKCYKLKSFSTFLKLLSIGIVTLNIKTGVYKSGLHKGKFHDHGISFCINRKDISKLFDTIDI